MAKLKTQLEEIEQCAQEATASHALPSGGDGDETDGAGLGGRASNSMSEKQKIIIEELRKRFDMQFGDLNNLRSVIYNAYLCVCIRVCVCDLIRMYSVFQINDSEN